MSDYEQTESGIMVPKGTEYRVDAWTNGLSGLGVPGLDKTQSTGYSVNGLGILNQFTLKSMYRNDWLSRKVCVRPAQDATRKFVQFADADLHKKLEEKFREIKLRQKIKTAISWSRLFGGAGIVLITNESDPTKPLKPSELDRLVDIEVYDRWWLNPVSYDLDYNSTNYMQPLVYQTGYGKQFHHSRICKFHGNELTREDLIENQYWGGSVVEQCYSAIRDLQATYQDVRHILTELNIGILKIPNLTNTQVQGGPAAAVQRRASQFNATKSNQRTAVIDSKEEFNFVNRTLTGVPDVMDRFKEAAAGACDMQELVLFGKSPSGLNASQEEQMQLHYDGIEDLRQDQVAPCIDTVLQACGYEGAEWSFESLWEMSDKDKATVMRDSAQAATALYNMGFTPEQVEKQLNQLGVWDFDGEDDDAPNLLDDDDE